MRSLRPSNTSYESKSWTDDLPVCKQSGVAFSTNQIYREDGNRQEEHPFEDRSFHCNFDVASYLYAVFDGHEGNRAVDFCYQRVAAELLLGQLNEHMTEEDIKEVLRQAFVSVEKGYMDSIYDLLAERASLSYDIPEGYNSYEAYQSVPEIVENIKRINYELSSGTAAAISLIYKNKLYVANVGNCRVLLCQNDENDVLKVVQLSIDHDLKNEDELLRLSQIGINTEVVRKHSHLGNQENTRCLGNHLVKGGYKEFEDLALAAQEPVTSEPDIIGGILLDETCKFLLLMSAGLYKSIEEATGTDHVNKYIAHCVVEQFREQTTLTGVAQAVVDKVVRLHHDWYMSNSCENNSNTKREDITLVLRNFNYPHPNALKSPTTPTVTFNPLVSKSTILSNRNSTLINSNISENTRHNTNDTSSSSDGRSEIDMKLGPDGKIKSYVDFNEFFVNLQTAKDNGTCPDGIDF